MDHVMILVHLVVLSECAKQVSLSDLGNDTLPGILISVAFNGLPINSTIFWTLRGAVFSKPWFEKWVTWIIIRCSSSPAIRTPIGVDALNVSNRVTVIISRNKLLDTCTSSSRSPESEEMFCIPHIPSNSPLILCSLLLGGILVFCILISIIGSDF